MSDEIGDLVSEYNLVIQRLADLEQYLVTQGENLYTLSNLAYYLQNGQFRSIQRTPDGFQIRPPRSDRRIEVPFLSFDAAEVRDALFRLIQLNEQKIDLDKNSGLPDCTRSFSNRVEPDRANR